MNPTVIATAPEVELQPQLVIVHPHLVVENFHLPHVGEGCPPADVQDQSILWNPRPS